MKDITSIKKYYDKHVIGKLKGFLYGNERVERAWDEINNWIFESPSHILEIGCGIGDISYRMAKKFPASKVLGFDVSETSIKVAQDLFSEENLNFIQANDISLLKSLNSKFDLIYLIDVFEHIPIDLRKNLFDFIKSNLINGGIVFISCPTIAHQNFLRDQQQELQPVDEDISINEVIEFAKGCENPLLFFKEICVWNKGDYFHAVFGKRKYEPFSDRRKTEQSIKKLIKERFYKKKFKEAELQSKITLLKNKLEKNQSIDLSCIL